MIDKYEAYGPYWEVPDSEFTVVVQGPYYEGNRDKGDLESLLFLEYLKSLYLKQLLD